MSIAATSHGIQRMNTLDADIDQLAHEMNHLHDIARLVGDGADHQRFARLEHSVNWRLNQLAYVLAAQDTGALTRHR